MEIEKKMEMLEEILELEKGTLAEETILNDINEWDSIAKLSLVALIEDEFGSKISGEQVRNLVSIKDILKLMK